MALLPPLLRGLQATAILWLGGSVLAIVLSFAAGLARLSPDPLLRGPAAAYVHVFRGTSALVQLFWFYFALPMVIDVHPGAMLTGTLVLGLNGGAYGAEIVRGAILAVPRGPVEAAVALDFTPALRLRHVVLPLALPGMIPPFGNLVIEILKGSALVSLITVTDLTLAARFLRDDLPSRTGEIFGLVLVLYFLLAAAAARAARRLEALLGRHREGEAAR